MKRKISSFLLRHITEKASTIKSRKKLISYFADRLYKLYLRNANTGLKERRRNLRNEEEQRRISRIKLAVSLKPALDPAMRQRIIELDKKLGFS